MPVIQQIIHAPAQPAVTAANIAQARQWLDATATAQPSWRDIVTYTDDLSTIERIAKNFRAQCAHVIICGTGGSSLSARALIDLIAHPLNIHDGKAPQLHLLDSTEPELLDAAFALPPETTGWIFISRSGGTLETVTQFLSFIAHGMHRRAACVQVITLPGEAAPSKNPLRALAQHYNVPVIDHMPSIGGRYAFFSNVGMLPAAILGFDIRALRAGGASMLADDGIAMALSAARWHQACITEHYHTHVMLPYHARLYGWTYWYRQLWAESLGKDGRGTTPLIGLAPLDQHSMLQLLLDGPRDKSITTLQVAPTASTRIPNAPLDTQLAAPESMLAFINGLEGGAIVEAQAIGTTQSFIKRHMPVRELHLPDLKETSIGALFMQQMLETVLTAQLLGVNAFDQPAVEESKTLAMRYLKGERA